MEVAFAYCYCEDEGSLTSEAYGCYVGVLTTICCMSTTRPLSVFSF